MEKKIPGRRDLKKSPITARKQKIIGMGPSSGDSTSKEEDAPTTPAKPGHWLEMEIFGREVPDEEFVAMSPSEAKDLLNAYALEMQKDLDYEYYFERILMYLHRYMMNLAYNKYIIKGYDGKDLYQESQITLRFKAIPNFDDTRGMSFLNFAKMCINRHFITLLNTSLTRRKDQPMNQAIPIDQAYAPDKDGNEDGPGLLNVLHEEENFLDEICRSEDMDLTLHRLVVHLSRFEALVLKYYLEKSSYREIAEMVSFELGKEFDEKSVDNALLRVRKKAVELLRDSDSDLPLFEEDNGN